jgi:DNA-binding FrmR family transcriptional regulator
MSINHECCGTRQASHSADFKKNLQHRLNRIEGQIRGINRMIQEDVYCDDILNQLTAVQNALSSAGTQLLEAHIKSCIVDQIQHGQVETLDELMKTIKKMMR